MEKHILNFYFDYGVFNLFYLRSFIHLITLNIIRSISINPINNKSNYKNYKSWN